MSQKIEDDILNYQKDDNIKIPLRNTYRPTVLGLTKIGPVFLLADGRTKVTKSTGSLRNAFLLTYLKTPRYDEC